MNRRQMVILPGVALAATRGFAQTQQPAAIPSGSGAVSRKAMARYGHLKYTYKVPHTASKQAKYISFFWRFCHFRRVNRRKPPAFSPL